MTDPHQPWPQQPGPNQPPPGGYGYPPQGQQPAPGQPYPGQPYPDQTQGLPAYGGQGGPPSQGPPPADEPQGGGRKRLLILGLVAALIAAGAGWWFFKPTSASANEVFLEAAADPGDDPFSDEAFADDPDSSIALPANNAAPTGAGSATSSSGGTTGLYGGTQNKAVCDPDKMIAFLKANPDKATAWVKAFNDDPDLRWENGPVTRANLNAYVAELTAVVLVQDTRVTNHGYLSGKPTQFQSVLQKGSAVMVDKYGVPRVRCFCGNPLRAPKATQGTTYRGQAWRDFDPTKVSVVKASSKEIKEFKVRVPAKPGGKISTLPQGRLCVPTPGVDPSECISKNVEALKGTKPTPKPTATATTPAPQQTTAAPTQTPQPTQTPSNTAVKCGAPLGAMTNPTFTNNGQTDRVRVVAFNSNCDAIPGSDLFIAPGQSVTVSAKVGQFYVAFIGANGDQEVGNYTVANNGSWNITF